MENIVEEKFKVLDNWILRHGNGLYISETFTNFGPGHGDVPIQQVRKELFELAKAFYENSVAGGTILEIGMGDHGGTAILWREIFKKVVTLELLELLLDRFKDENPDLLSTTNFIKKIDNDTKLDDTKKHELIFGHSCDENIFNFCKRNLSPVDVLFIDGEHTYQATQKDTLLYSPLVREGGMIVWHDAFSRAWQVNRFLGDYQNGNIDGKRHEIKGIFYSQELGIAYEIKK